MIAAMSLSDSDICVAHDGSIMHATFALMNSNLSTSLDKFLDSGGRKMALWYRKQNTKRVDVSNHLEVLTNLNSPEDF
jgi:molybdopterin-guanine dinucleotide biosynthesis protein A